MLIDQMKNKLRTMSMRDILVVMGWAATITLMTIIAEYAKPPLAGSYAEGTTFDALDLAIILAMSLVFGIFLVDPVKILYGFIGAIFLSIVISVIYSSLYDLYVLGLGKNFSEIVPGWEWEWVTWFAFFRIFRIMFPAAIVLIFVGGMIGGIVGEFVWAPPGTREKVKKANR